MESKRRIASASLRQRLTASSVLIVALLAAGAASSSPKGLTATWWRDPDGSDDAEKKIHETVSAMVKKAARRNRNLPSDDMPRIAARLQHIIAMFVQFAESLEIEETNAEIRIDDGEGRLRIFYVDGKKHQRQAPDGTKLETLCRRQGNQVLIEQKLKGGEILETYALSGDGEQMLLTVRFSSKAFPRPLIVRSLYERDATSP